MWWRGTVGFEFRANNTFVYELRHVRKRRKIALNEAQVRERFEQQMRLHPTVFRLSKLPWAKESYVVIMGVLESTDGQLYRGSTNSFALVARLTTQDAVEVVGATANGYVNVRKLTSQVFAAQQGEPGQPLQTGFHCMRVDVAWGEGGQTTPVFRALQSLPSASAQSPEQDSASQPTSSSSSSNLIPRRSARLAAGSPPLAQVSNAEKQQLEFQTAATVIANRLSRPGKASRKAVQRDPSQHDDQPDSGSRDDQPADEQKEDTELSQPHSAVMPTKRSRT